MNVRTRERERARLNGARARRKAAVESGLGPEVALTGYVDPRWSIAERMAHYRVPGLAVGVLDAHECDWLGGYGVLRNGRSTPVTADTRFPLSCCSQALASLAVLQLESERRLSADADVNHVLAGWRLPCGDFAAPSARQLLAHVGGTNVRYFEAYSAAEPLPSLRAALDGAAPALNPPVKVIAAPGSEYRFSSGGYAVVEQLLIDTARMPFPQIVRTLLLDPIRLTDTTFGDAANAAFEARTAYGHREDGTVIPLFEFRSVSEAACGGWSTCRDAVRFLAALAHAYRDDAGTGVSSAAARALFQPVGFDSVGCGLQIRGAGESLSITATGHHNGHSCVLMLFPSAGLGAVVMTNGTNSRGLTLEVLRSIATVYGWPYLGARRVPYRPPSASSVADVCGEYAIGDRIIAIALVEGTLTWHGQRGLRMEAYLTADGYLVLQDGRSFECQLDEEGRVIGLRSGHALMARKIAGDARGGVRDAAAPRAGGTRCALG